MGKLAEIKTKETESSVEDFLNKSEEKKCKDSFVLLNLMQQLSGEPPRMWGSSIIGFGKMRYKSPGTGREVDWFKIGFSPRKANLTIYLAGDVKKHAASLDKLGKHKIGGGCLYINKLDDVDMNILKSIIELTLKDK